MNGVHPIVGKRCSRINITYIDLETLRNLGDQPGLYSLSTQPINTPLDPHLRHIRWSGVRFAQLVGAEVQVGCLVVLTLRRKLRGSGQVQPPFIDNAEVFRQEAFPTSTTLDLSTGCLQHAARLDQHYRVDL